MIGRNRCLWCQHLECRTGGGKPATLVAAGEQPVVAQELEAGGSTWCRKRPMNASVDVSTTMIYTHVLKVGGAGVRSPIDALLQGGMGWLLLGDTAE